MSFIHTNYIVIQSAQCTEPRRRFQYRRHVKAAAAIQHITTAAERDTRS